MTIKNWSALGACLVLLATPAAAKKNNPNVDLKFTPQQEIAEAEFVADDEVYTRPISIQVIEARPYENLEVIGKRSDDKDRTHELKATSEVARFVEQALKQAASNWRLKVEDDAPARLVIELKEFTVEENNQAVGAYYSGQVNLQAHLENRGGKSVWTGTFSGDTGRYGKKFSNENVNEVLSDALLEAFGELLSDSALQREWIALTK